MKKSLTASLFAIASISALAFVAGCSAGVSPAQVFEQTKIADSPEFLGSWSLNDAKTDEPSLREAPAAVAPDGTVELIFYFDHPISGEPMDVTDSYVVSATGVFVELSCAEGSPIWNEAMECITPRFADITNSPEYRAVVQTSEATLTGTAAIMREL